MHTFNRYKKRFFYPPGFISLLILAPLCMLYLYKNKAFESPRVIELLWWNESWGKICLEESAYNVHSERKFIDINLTTNDEEAKTALDFARLEIKKLIATKDTVKGIHIHFENDANYWTFIRAIDICFTEKAKTFIPKDNDLWIYNDTPKPIITECHPPPMLCGTSFMGCIDQIDNKLEVAEEKGKKIDYIKELIKQYWLPGALQLY